MQSKGMNVAFVSSKYTRNLYRGMVEITPIEATDLPEEDSTVESVATGNGVDVCIMCAVLEGKLWKDDIKLLDNDSNHNGIFSLSGAAHVGRSRTAWANINENKSNASKRKTGDALPYHIPKSFMKSGKSVWTKDERPYYMYVQDPANVRLVFTLYDDDIVGSGSVISSTSISLKELLPKVNSNIDIIDKIKQDIVQKMVSETKNGDPSKELDVSKLNTEISNAITKVVETDYTWEGPLKMDIKPKIENKNSQIATGAAAGAMVAGPIGAAAGAAFGAFYEGQAKGTVKLKLRYLPVPPSTSSSSSSKSSSGNDKYRVLGGLPGIDWGNLYELHSKESYEEDEVVSSQSLKLLGGNDLEFCFFINHDQTGASVGVYRSLENKRIVVSFRGTCQPIDLITDASIFQVPWIESDEYNDKELKNIDHNTFSMVHVGFRKSMDSIARRLKTLVLGTVPPGESIEEYEILVTGHSLGGALATLFTADIAEFGIDAGRSLPTKTPSDPWWKGIASTFNLGDDSSKDNNVIIPSSSKGPPRPKSLKMYNFGSPRAGNTAFSNQFELMLKEGKIDEAYRIVNSQDIVARVPRPMLNLGVDYEHCGRTVLIEEPTKKSTTSTTAGGGTEASGADSDTDPTHVLWIEGESEFERLDPVRDMKGATKGILSKGTFLDELVQTYKGDAVGGKEAIDAADALQQLVSGENDAGDDDAALSSSSASSNGNDFTSRLNAVATRLKSIDVADITSVVGIDRNYANREIELASSFMKGDSLAHHLEDSYYNAMGRAVGYNTTVGENIQKLV
jgi:hypothetical protein